MKVTRITRHIISKIHIASSRVPTLNHSRNMGKTKATTMLQLNTRLLKLKKLSIPILGEIKNRNKKKTGRHRWQETWPQRLWLRT